MRPRSHLTHTASAPPLPSRLLLLGYPRALEALFVVGMQPQVALEGGQVAGQAACDCLAWLQQNERLSGKTLFADLQTIGSEHRQQRPLPVALQAPTSLPPADTAAYQRLLLQAHLLALVSFGGNVVRSCGRCVALTHRHLARNCAGSETGATARRPWRQQSSLRLSSAVWACCWTLWTTASTRLPPSLPTGDAARTYTFVIIIASIIIPSLSYAIHTHSHLQLLVPETWEEGVGVGVRC